MMRPVHETAQIVPFIHAPDLDAIAQSYGYRVSEVDIVRDQQRCTAADINDEALVARTIIVIR